MLQNEPAAGAGAMLASALSVTPLTYSVSRADVDLVVFCIAKPEDAEVFRERFGQGNESRLTRHRPQYLHEISRVHGGALATPFDGTLIGDFTHEIEGEMADHGHVLGSVAYTQA